MSDVLYHLLVVFGVLGCLLLAATGLIWGERKLLALWQDRHGPNRVGPAGVFQVVADMIKIFTKEDWVPPFADRPVFVMAPAIVMIVVLISFAIVPVAPGIVVVDLNVGLLFFLALSSMSVYSIALAGWSSNNKYALLGSMRAVGQMISYEVFMAMSLLGVVLQAGSFSFVDIVNDQKGLWNCVPQFVGMVVFLTAGLAEARRLPFDLPESENELVAGFHTEYSGLKFAMFFLAEYVGITLVAAVTVTMFFGGWHGPLLPPVMWFVLKTMLVVSFFVLCRASLPRPRYDQLMAVGWKYMLPLALVNLLVTGAVVLARGI
jgi:NADH-quinone oxidoreductase subunit H